jgi:hypothetical protein
MSDHDKINDMLAEMDRGYAPWHGDIYRKKLIAVLRRALEECDKAEVNAPWSFDEMRSEIAKILEGTP